MSDKNNTIRYLNLLALISAETNPVRKEKLKAKLEECKKELEKERATREEKEKATRESSEKTFIKTKETTKKQELLARGPSIEAQRIAKNLENRKKNSTTGQIHTKNLDHYSTPYERDRQMALRKARKKY